MDGSSQEQERRLVQDFHTVDDKSLRRCGMPIFRLARDRSRTSARRSSSIPVRAASMAMVMSSAADDGGGRTVRVSFDTGAFRGTPVPLGELEVDSEGRLLVLGGFGNSGSTKPDNPIGADPQDDDYWANNDYWYDDVSDGTVTARCDLADWTKGRRSSSRMPRAPLGSSSLRRNSHRDRTDCNPLRCHS